MLHRSDTQERHTGSRLRGPRLASGRARCVVNDVHSQLNATAVERIERPHTIEALQDALGMAWGAGRSVSVAGGRHAMGGQQFATGAVLIDTRSLNRILGMDADAGTVTVESGVQWPALIEHLVSAQAGRPRQWGIVQKQTGADRLTIGGALAANVHGRGLQLEPFVDQVEAFTILDADGAHRRCSRDENVELFRLAIGGYGMFGVATSVTLRLMPRHKVQRCVEIRDVDGVVEAFAERVRDGFEFGDFQFATDSRGDTFLRRGVFSCYRPVPISTPIPDGQRRFTLADWGRLTYLAHVDKPRAFEMYAAHYCSTDGQVYWSDTHQLSDYVDDYHAKLDSVTCAPHTATEMITEIYVPRAALSAFLTDARDELRSRGASLIYGTIRLIERDTETVLAWARERWACVIFNLHTVHTPEGLEAAASAFRGLIDLAIARGGSYYLTYHRWATKQQVLASHPRFVEWMNAKRRHDPYDRFTSDWYRHHRRNVMDL